MLEITSLAAGVAAVALVGLSIAVSLRRMKVDTRIGTGDDDLLLRRIRAQGNFIEYVPLALILLALAEFREAAPSLLWTIAGMLAIGRLAHLVGILTASTPIRATGMLLTYGSLLLGAWTLLS